MRKGAFEAINRLPTGTMGRLREHCTVNERLEHYTVLGDTPEPTLYFIFRGALALIHQLANSDIIFAESGRLHAEVC